MPAPVRIPRCLFLLGLAAAGARSGLAHDEKVSASEVEIDGRTVVWRIDVGLVGLAKAVNLPADPAALSEAQLESSRGAIGSFLARGVSVEMDGRPVPAEIGRMDPIYEPFLLSGEPYVARVRQELRFHGASPAERVRLGIRLFAEITAQHRAVVDVRWGGEARHFVRVGPCTLDLVRGALHPTFRQTFVEFLRWGAHHIFVGYDHIAFLMALVVGARRLREMVKVVTAFTAAHSLTLLLSALDVVRLNPSLTESLIAASIVYVGAENYFLDDGRHRWLLAFAFGLVHGLGFSSALRERLAEAAGIAVPVLSFNLGVELGQLAILGATYPVLLWLRRGADDRTRERRQRRIVYIGSLPIVLLGLGWLIERAFGLQFMPL